MSRPVPGAATPIPKSRDRFVDTLKVELACTQGYGAAPLTIRERGLAIERLTPTMSANEIADLLGVCRRTVQRYQAGEVANANARVGRKRRRTCAPRPVSPPPRGRKLTPDAVTAMRTRFQEGEPKKALGRQYGVSATMVRRIVTGVAWTHVPQPERAAA